MAVSGRRKQGLALLRSWKFQTFPGDAAAAAPHPQNRLPLLFLYPGWFAIGKGTEWKERPKIRKHKDRCAISPNSYLVMYTSLLALKKKKKCYKKSTGEGCHDGWLVLYHIFYKIFCFCVNGLPVRKIRAVALMAQPFVHWALHLRFALNLVHALSPREAQGKDNSYFFNSTLPS